VDNAEHIRVEATRMFASRGFDGVSLQAIADKVGVAKQTLLYHYPSKDALKRAVIDNLFEHWRDRLPQILEAVTSGHGRFSALTDELLSFFAKDEDRARLIVRELLDNPDGMSRVFADKLRPWLLLVAQYIREGQRLGMIYEDVDPEAYVLHVVVSVVGTVATQSLTQGAFNGEGGESRALKELKRVTRAGLFKPRDEKTARKKA
jgi:TetR/AcrR family transcriptional regulator